MVEQIVPRSYVREHFANPPSVVFSLFLSSFS